MNRSEFIREVADWKKKNKLALFVGAGVSISAGLKGWADITKELCKYSRDTIADASDFALYTQYLSNRSRSVKIKGKVLEHLKIKKPKSKLLDVLVKYNFQTIWTTNYDNVIELSYKDQQKDILTIAEETSLIDSRNAQGGLLYKIHGDRSNTSGIILTKDDFENFNRPIMLSFLKRDLVVNSFIFVGYSFKDELILKQLREIQISMKSAAPEHYAIFIRNSRPDLNSFVDDLQRRYGVISLIVKRKEDIEVILNKIYQISIEKNVFISGSFCKNQYFTFRNTLIRKLVYKLIDNGYNIYTGVGKGLGALVTGYANEHLLNTENSSTRLVMRPYPFHLDLTKAQKELYRKNMMEECRASIFLFGESENPKNRRKRKYSDGVYQEFEIANKLGQIIIPVAATGLEAEMIFEEVKKQPNKYPYLEKKYDNLKRKNFTQIIDTIMDILSPHQQANNLSTKEVDVP